MAAEADDIRAQQILHDIEHFRVSAELKHPAAAALPVLYFVAVDPLLLRLRHQPVEVFAVRLSLGRREDLDRLDKAPLVVLRDPASQRNGISREQGRTQRERGARPGAGGPRLESPGPGSAGAVTRASSVVVSSLGVGAAGAGALLLREPTGRPNTVDWPEDQVAVRALRLLSARHRLVYVNVRLGVAAATGPASG